MACSVDELSVYQKALVAADARSATLARPVSRRDFDLERQLNRAAVQVVSNIAEGFGQSTDRHFASYLYRARGGTREIRAQLQIAADRARLTDADRGTLSTRFEELARMLTGLIRHLEREDRKHRR